MDKKRMKELRNRFIIKFLIYFFIYGTITATAREFPEAVWLGLVTTPIVFIVLTIALFHLGRPITENRIRKRYFIYGRILVFQLTFFEAAVMIFPIVFIKNEWLNYVSTQSIVPITLAVALFDLRRFAIDNYFFIADLMHFVAFVIISTLILINITHFAVGL